jgi:hypothetical protein
LDIRKNNNYNNKNAARLSVILQGPNLVPNMIMPLAATPIALVWSWFIS